MDVFDLFATITLDDEDYRRKMQEDSETGNSWAEKAKSAFGTVGKVGAVALGAAATAVGFLTKTAVSGFAEQEQLIGGVQKLYGNMGMSVEEYAASVGKSVDEANADWQKLEKAQNTVLQNAKNAYKTAGMSANQYMETATSFSAALINSLGGDTQKAAEQTDVAMRAISDNFNTFGGDISMIQSAFMGFSKQNYQMLDNLKLGYGGTKTEMERLISDANKYAESIGQASDLSINSFSDIVTAIDLVQQKQNIAGTTAREAAQTVEGSLGMLRGAWTNLLAGLGDADADIGQLVDNVVSSAETVATNVMPVIQNALQGIGTLITNIAPIISEKLPELIQTLLPPLIQAATQLVLGLVQALPTIIQGLIEAIPTVINAIVSMDWASFASQIMQAFITGFSSVIGTLGVAGDMTMEQILDTIGSRLSDLVDKGVEIIGKFAEGILQGAPQAINSLFNVISRLVAYIMQNLPQFIEKGVAIVGSAAKGIIQNIPAIVAAIQNGIAQLLSTIAKNLPQFLQKGIELVGKIAAGLINALPTVVSSILQIINNMKSKFTSTNWASIGLEIMNGVANGIRNGLSNALNAMEGAAKSVLQKAKNALGIKSPSTVFRDIIGKNIDLGIAKGILDTIPIVNAAMEDLEDDLVAGMDDIDVGSDTTVTSLDNGGTAGSQKIVNNSWTINVDGAENPEQFADRMVKELQMQVRMA